MGKVMLVVMDCVAEDSAQNANVFDMVVLEVKSLYLYTIPSFSAITLKLSMHMFRAEDTGVATCRVLRRVFPPVP